MLRALGRQLNKSSSSILRFSTKPQPVSPFSTPQDVKAQLEKRREKLEEEVDVGQDNTNSLFYKSASDSSAEPPDLIYDSDEDELVDLVNPETGEWNGPRGPEPTRHGDWHSKGRCSDFS